MLRKKEKEKKKVIDAKPKLCQFGARIASSRSGRQDLFNATMKGSVW